MAVNKVEYNEKVIIDLTSDTVTSEKLAYGVTCHDKSGKVITGTLRIVQRGNSLILPGSITNVENSTVKISV